MINNNNNDNNYNEIIKKKNMIWISLSSNTTENKSKSNNKKAERKEKLNTRRILEGSLAEAIGEERQSATARRKGSGNFLMEEDLNLETPFNCGVKLEDIGFDSISG